MSPVEHELQTHAAALRRLARDLVGSSDADDLVQETALRALRSPPHLPGGLGGFLATILRRLAGTHWREQRRRLRREQAAARPEPVQAPDQALERGETLQLLTAAVMALPQPYRDVVLQRYFEGLRPAAIARHLDLPVATVKTRLQRGLQKLREQLDANRERSAWRGALAGAFGLGRLAAGLTGVFVMGTGTKLAIGGAAALLAAGAWVAWPGEPGTALATGSIEAGSAQPVVAAAGTRQGTPAAEAPLLREEVQPTRASPDKHVTI
ncbi:MAG TPA: RNA polymerase sigma factor, partial [Planctomycetota bacterium]|nr:RNA polymerase sigma factor [Planctomycetota bacterium]